jgi:hypothetical protein
MSPDPGVGALDVGDAERVDVAVEVLRGREAQAPAVDAEQGADVGRRAAEPPKLRQVKGDLAPDDAHADSGQRRSLRLVLSGFSSHYASVREYRYLLMPFGYGLQRGTGLKERQFVKVPADQLKADWEARHS